MLEFIKNKLSERMPNIVTHNDDSVPNSVVLECAHLIQELDELSIEGQDTLDMVNGVSNRPLANALEIPLEDDIEIGSVELNIVDGRIIDTPKDAAVPTVNEYATMPALKTSEDFYKEACEIVKPFIRDTAESLEERRRAYAEKEMEKYTGYLVQEGLFDFNKIKITDPSVPRTVIMNFGPINEEGSKDYLVKLPVLFQVDKSNKITKKQMESVSVVNNLDAFVKLRHAIFEAYSGNSKFTIEETQIWNHATPKELRVPVGPSDKYIVYVVIDTDWDGEQSFSCTVNVKGSKAKKEFAVKKASENVATKEAYKSPKEVIKEYAEMEVEKGYKEKTFPSRFYNEAVDMGTDGDVTDNPPASGASSDVTIDAGGEGNDNPPSTDAAPAESDNQVEVPVKTNDVSDQIADKVAEETNENTPSEEDVTAEVDALPDEGSDLSTDLDGSLDDTSTDDNAGTDENIGDADIPGETPEESNVDISQIENMSIDELLNQGSEKLKTMSIGQLKQFLAGDENLDPMVEEAFQEAFFLTPRNINKEIYKELKRVMGILNESNESGLEILNKFKKYSRRLNRALSKASKMSKVYNDSERSTFMKLNKCMNDMNIIIGSAKDANYAATIKRLIQAFVSQAKSVESIITEHDPSLKMKKSVDSPSEMKKGTTNVADTLKQKFPLKK